MSSVYSIGQRTPAINSLLAGLACAIALTVTAGPALAQPAPAASTALTAPSGATAAPQAAVENR